MISFFVIYEILKLITQQDLCGERGQETQVGDQWCQAGGRREDHSQDERRRDLVRPRGGHQQRIRQGNEGVQTVCREGGDHF